MDDDEGRRELERKRRIKEKEKEENHYLPKSYIRAIPMADFSTAPPIKI
jgi:hypothetical protein